MTSGLFLTHMDSSSQKIGWGLIGPGRFAQQFAAQLREVPRANLIAVASRNLDRSKAFAEEFGFKRAYGDYESIFSDEEVDIIYIVVPHTFHRQLAEQAIHSDKAVLCEKPLTPTAEDTRNLISLAKDKDVFLMEAMKTGFLPAIRKAKQWIEEGAIGTPQILKADFCFLGSQDPKDRLLNPDLAGGAILDVGIYPLYLAQNLFGDFEEIRAAGSLAETGVEHTVSMAGKHQNGATSAMTCSFNSAVAMDAVVLGTEGEIRIPKFHAAVEAELLQDGKLMEKINDDGGGKLRGEIEAVTDSLLAGEKECFGHTHYDTQKLANNMDEVRRQVLN